MAKPRLTVKKIVQYLARRRKRLELELQDPNLGYDALEPQGAYDELGELITWMARQTATKSRL